MKKLNYFLLFFIFQGEFLLSSNHAPSLTTSFGPRARALGNAPSKDFVYDALITNPASLVNSKEYQAEAVYSIDNSLMGVAVIDNKAKSFGGGMYYSQQKLSDLNNKPLFIGNNKYFIQEFGLSFFDHIGKNLGFSVQGTFRNYDFEDLNIKQEKKINVGAGIYYQLNQFVSFSVSGNNLLGSKDGFERANINGGLTLAKESLQLSLYGFKYLDKQKSSYKFELFKPDEDFSYGGSLSYLYKKLAKVSVGYSFLNYWGVEQLSSGLSLFYENLILGYSFQMNLKGDQDKYQSHSFSLGINL